MADVQREDIGVYFFEGFLEGGKTTYIQSLISDPNLPPDLRILIFITGQKNYRNLTARCFALTQFCEGFVAVHSGHPYIQKNQFRTSVFADVIKQLFAGFQGNSFHTRIRQTLPGFFQNNRIVVDDDDSLIHNHLPPCRSTLLAAHR